MFRCYHDGNHKQITYLDKLLQYDKQCQPY